jgi:hypothetical protein
MKRAAALAAAVAAAALARPPQAEGETSTADSLVLLVEGDAVLASTPGAPDDPPSGAELRLRRMRAGEDLTLGAFRARFVFEGQSKNADGANFTPMEGGRLSGPMRATEAFVSFAPQAAFHAEAGSLRVPFSLSRQVNEAFVRLPERAPIVDAVAPDFRTGAGVGGDLGALGYRAAVLAADPWLDGRLFRDGAFVAARLAAEPIGPVGVTPWRRPARNAWDDWFRFSVGVSFLHGSLTEPRTTAAGADLGAAWRSFAATGEYIYSDAPSGAEQGAVIEPGVALWGRRLMLVARGDWRRAGVDQWGGGAALTLAVRDPCLRLQAGFERRDAAGVASGWAIVRLIVSTEP